MKKAIPVIIIILFIVIIFSAMFSDNEKSSTPGEKASKAITISTAAAENLKLVESKWIQHGYRMSCTEYVQFANDGSYIAISGSDIIYSGTYKLTGKKLYIYDEYDKLLDIMNYNESNDSFVGTMRDMAVVDPNDDRMPMSADYELTRCTDLTEWQDFVGDYNYNGFESPEYPWAKDIPNIKEIVACYESSYNGEFLVTTGDDGILNENTMVMDLLVTNFKSVAEVRKNLCRYLTPELADEMLVDNNFKEINGQLYIMESFKGTVLYKYNDRQLVKKTENGLYYITCSLYNSGEMYMEDYNFYLKNTSSGLRLCKVEEVKTN